MNNMELRISPPHRKHFDLGILYSKLYLICKVIHKIQHIFTPVNIFLADV